MKKLILLLPFFLLTQITSASELHDAVKATDFIRIVYLLETDASL